MMITIPGITAHTEDTLSTVAESQSLPTILLVNMDADVLERFKESFTLHVASNGLSALEELRRAVPDAIVVDIDGPRASGVVLAEEIRDWGFPLVLTTSSRDRRVISGAEYLEKPFEPSDLAKVLTRAIERGKSQFKSPAQVVRRRVLSG
jgi:DNA-binding response OmpR family regulator